MLEVSKEELKVATDFLELKEKKEIVDYLFKSAARENPMVMRIPHKGKPKSGDFLTINKEGFIEKSKTPTTLICL